MHVQGRFSSGTLPLDLAHSGTKILLRKVCEHPFLSQNLSTGGSATPFEEHPGGQTVRGQVRTSKEGTAYGYEKNIPGCRPAVETI